MSSFFTEGHLEVLDGHLLPGSFALPAIIPAPSGVALTSAAPASSIHDVAGVLPSLPSVPLSPFGCDWCGGACVPGRAFCSTEHEKLFADLPIPALREDAPDLFGLLDAMAEDEF